MLRDAGTRWSGVLGWVGVAVGYVLASAALLWPLPAHFGTHVWGDRFDAWTTLWLMDHLSAQIAAGTLTATTDSILFPVGYNLWSFGHAALQLVGVALMLLGVPLVTAYNVLLVGGLASSGLGAHVLGRTLHGGHRGGWIAGLVFMTSPYLYGEGAAGCVELVAAGMIPWFAASVVWLVRAPGWRNGLLVALSLALVGPFNWYYTLFTGMLGVGLLVWQLVARRHAAAAWLTAAMVLAAALDAPLIPLVRRETPARPPLDVGSVQLAQPWTDKVAFSDGLLPLDSLTESFLEEQDALEVIDNSTQLSSLVSAPFSLNPLDSTPGAFAFAVGLVGWAAAGRRGFGWGAILLGATLLTLGPFLRVDDQPPVPRAAAEWPLPYYWFYQYVPFFSKAYRPYRIGVVALVALAALASAGLAALESEHRRLPGRLLVAALALVGLSQPAWSGDRPMWRPLADTALPPVYEALAELPRGGVVELPLQYQPLTVANARYQYAQIAHRQPLLNCNQLIRRTDLFAFVGYVQANSFLSTLVDLGRKRGSLAFSGADVAAARADGFRYVIQHTRVETGDAQLASRDITADFLGEPAGRLLERALGAPVLEADGVRVFGLPEPGTPLPTRWIDTGSDVVDLDPPVDSAQLGLPLSVAPGGEVELYTGEASQLSFWAQAAAGPAPVVRVRSEAATVDLPVDVTPGTWSWVRLPVAADGPVTLLFGAGEGGAALHVTRMQVVR
jgi:hypothetical protein